MPSSLRKAQQVATGLFCCCLPISIAASNVALGLMSLIYLITIVINHQGKFYSWTGFEYPWIAYFLVTVLSSLFSPSPLYSFTKLSSEVLILAFIVSSQMQNKEDVKRNLYLLMFSMGLASLWGIFQYGFNLRFVLNGSLIGNVPLWLNLIPPFFLNELITPVGRSVGFYSHPLTFSGVLLLIAPFFIFLLAYYIDKDKRNGERVKVGEKWGMVLSIMGLLICLGGIFGSGSRMAWVSFFFVIMLWGLLMRKKKLLYILLGGGILFGGILFSQPKMKTRFSEIYNLEKNTSFQIRSRLWKNSFKKWKQRPVFGYGVGNFSISGDELNWQGSPFISKWSETHNIFLQALVERGLVGFVAFLFLLFYMGKVFWLAKKDIFTCAFSVGFFSLVLSGLTESWMNDSEVVLVLFFLLGSASVIYRANVALRKGRPL